MGKIKAAIIGSTGYAGAQLAALLYNHREVEIKYLTSKTYLNQKYSDIYQNFNSISDIICTEDELEEISKNVDVIFLALPHGIASKKVTKEVLYNSKVIDLGADFRLKDKETYEKWYNVEHFSPELLNEAVYGLPEIYGDKIKNAALIANPGCYTTCSILSIYPLVKNNLIDTNSIIIDAKSGVTGAGRGVNLGVHYCETNENIKAYKISSHRHTPEIEQELSFALNKKMTLQFTPHLVPMNRGILTTSYAKLNENVTKKDIVDCYFEQYKNKKFVRILKEGIYPETKWTKGTNFIDIGIFTDTRTNNVIISAAIDNLMKGAAGQAVQNMNLMFNLDESEGLITSGIFPA